jgi:molybdopterin-guanine dinucleotide biosynthesis protein A
MTEQTEEHFEVIDKNKAERYERQKLTYLEDRVKTLEKSIEGIHKILARFQMTEGKEHLTTEQG